MLYLRFQISARVFFKFMCCFAVPSLGSLRAWWLGEIVRLLGNILLGA